MNPQTVWVGLAVLRLSLTNKKRVEGFTGAFAGVACLANDVAEAVDSLAKEFNEHGYELIGFENFLPVSVLERELTPYEEGLVEAATSYPVQFKDLHLHKGDG